MRPALHYFVCYYIGCNLLPGVELKWYSTRSRSNVWTVSLAGVLFDDGNKMNHIKKDFNYEIKALTKI